MENQTIQIRKLNDLLRGTFLTGKVLFTQGFQGLNEEAKQALITKVREFKDFNIDNDSYGEHDFGAVTHDDIKVFWKIDYYDLAYQYASEDAANHKITRRVLTLMLASEY